MWNLREKTHVVAPAEEMAPLDSKDELTVRNLSFVWLGRSFTENCPDTLPPVDQLPRSLASPRAAFHVGRWAVVIAVKRATS